MKVRAGQTYKFDPVPLDRIHDAGAINLPTGTIVRVINLPSAPKCNTMGQCHIEHLDGTFIGMVSTNSLTRTPRWHVHRYGFHQFTHENKMTYRIVRFHSTGIKQVIESGLTLEEAQEHCQDPDTSGDGWFDGYEREDD